MSDLGAISEPVHIDQERVELSVAAASDGLSALAWVEKMMDEDKNSIVLVTQPETVLPKLRLNKETLRRLKAPTGELSMSDLQRVVGASASYKPTANCRAF